MKSKKLIFGKLLPYSLTVLLLGLSVFMYAQNTSQEVKFKSFLGEVYNRQDRSPVVFASVFIKGTNIGTVTNSEGKFIIKIPDAYLNQQLGISSMGYKTLYVKLNQLSSKLNHLALEPAIVPLNEVVIRHLNPLTLLNDAIARIHMNYSNVPVMMTAFYRESIKKNRNYVSVAEAVLRIYKASYTSFLDNDRITIFKGRKSQAVRRMDTLLVKLQGGPLTVSSLDIVKNPGNLFSPDILSDYNYQMAGVVFINGRETYEIQFEQKDTVSLPLYKGSVFLDAKSLAFAGAKFEISPKKDQEATKYLVTKKPAGLKTNLLGAHYLVKYRKIGTHWYLNYIRVENRFRFKWKKRLFHSNYTIVSETAITDIDHNNVVKPKFSQRIKPREIFSDKVSAFEDPTFWGSSNIIEPESSIQSAIKKIRRKLERWNHH